MDRVYNFNPGPATLPLPVLEQAHSTFLNYQDTGMSVLEISHRSQEFEEIIYNAETLFKELAGVGDDYRVLFLQGGASLQFSMIPLNFLSNKSADYVLTGQFAEKAYEEAKKIAEIRVAATTAADNFSGIPSQNELQLDSNAAYLHITTNNTIFGTEWHYIPETFGVPLIADMSSDIFSRPLDYSKFALVYAGAQKNLGTAGVTVVLIRKELLEHVPSSLPSMLRYDVYAKNDSLYNTPPTFGVYLLKLVLEWLKEKGGLAAMGKLNAEKAALVYAGIDGSNDFYQGHARQDSRSLMNITFRLPSAGLEKQFLAQAAAAKLVGLKGHRSVGGIRASVYNAMSSEGCEKLAEFMETFRKRHG
ncbi:MAG: 3-phosphoserine/phosphohydroxythreonine transaminase [Firmicutes bacterium]|nr:3-phosphoserine/phosphohydroxythreonine transaminase [Dethiobacter sp.]MBS3899995.1 3-phosphoserine/phosphohydroxythreonine transaminase [Dethiobacter sp.]MCL4463437.1 3-phosphoserine/phosphohydroxythreonine transaminase [Bacillota bacterium]MCL5992558.1 3-phosphoserine/phosphohydroxythreonine transaminase [Bacillota bacterium]